MDEAKQRKVVGDLVKQLVVAKFSHANQSYETLSMSPTSLTNVMRGVKVRPLQWRKLEKGLDLPDFLLDHVYNADIKAIEKLDMAEPLRQFVLSLLRNPKTGSSQPEVAI